MLTYNVYTRPKNLSCSGPKVNRDRIRYFYDPVHDERGWAVHQSKSDRHKEVVGIAKVLGARSTVDTNPNCHSSSQVQGNVLDLELELA